MEQKSDRRWPYIAAVIGLTVTILLALTPAPMMNYALFSVGLLGESRIGHIRVSLPVGWYSIRVVLEPPSLANPAVGKLSRESLVVFRVNGIEREPIQCAVIFEEVGNSVGLDQHPHAMEHTFPWGRGIVWPPIDEVVGTGRTDKKEFNVVFAPAFKLVLLAQDERDIGKIASFTLEHY